MRSFNRGSQEEPRSFSSFGSIMRTLQERIVLASLLLSLVCAVEVASLPLREPWSGLLQRTKRSMVWRWNSMKPVGASCRGPSECGTKYCRKKVCSFYLFR